MARRRKKRRQKQKAIRAQQKANRPAARLTEAHNTARQGNLPHALELCMDALHAANDQNTVQRASSLAADLHYRLAAQGETLPVRLSHLEDGERLAPDDWRFAYHCGLTLLVQQQPDAALQAFERAMQLAPPNAQITHLIALTRAQIDPTIIPPETPEALAPTLDMLTTVARKQLDPVVISEYMLAALPGDDTTRWRSLLTMAIEPSSSRLTGLEAKANAAAPDLAAPILNYYAGVAAMRRNDHETAAAAWLSAQQAGLDTPWFQSGRLYVLRQSAEQLAAQEAWTEVVILLDKDPLAQSDKALKELLGYGNFHLGAVEAEAKQWNTAAFYWRRAKEQVPSRQLSQNLALAEEANEEWHAAAEAWRDMIRRRPRKTDHPDYMNEYQVALLWRRIAECYSRASNYHEQITCLSKAIDYAPDNLTWRIQLVRAYLEDEREDAAENELHRILNVDSEYMPALIDLATLYDRRWDRDALHVWRRALAADERNEDARNGLARALLEDAKSFSGRSYFASLMGETTGQSDIKKLEKAIREVPDHALLLYELGCALDANGKKSKARKRLSEAGRIAGRAPASNVGLLGEIMHDLLHAEGDEHVPELMEILRTVPSLRAIFWYEQGDQVLDCDLKPVWAERFWQEALDLAKRRPKPDSPASILFFIIGSIDMNDLYFVTWADNFVEAIDDIAPNSGLHEYVAALEARSADDDGDKSLRLLRRAIRKARAAGETDLLENLERIEGMTTGAFRSPLDALFGGMDAEDIAAMLDDFGDIPDIFR